MLGALTSRTRATTDALLREARFDAATVHERHSAGEPSPSWSNGSCDIIVLLFTTKIKQCVPFSRPHNSSFKLEIAFCVSGVSGPPCGVPRSVFDHCPSSDTPALNHLPMRRSIRRSELRCLTKFMYQ